MNARAYFSAINADAAYSDELIRVFGKDAGDARYDARGEVVAYFGRAAYRVALDACEESSACPLTVGHARPTVYPMNQTTDLVKVIQAVQRIARRAFADGWTGASSPMKRAGDRNGYELRLEDLADLSFTDPADRAEIQDAVRAELVALTAEARARSGEPETSSKSAPAASPAAKTSLGGPDT